MEDARITADLPADELIALDDQLQRLSESDAQAAQLVQLHCFAGLSIEQAAEVLGISARSAYRDWAYARAWLYRAMEKDYGTAAD